MGGPKRLSDHTAPARLPGHREHLYFFFVVFLVTFFVTGGGAGAAFFVAFFVVAAGAAALPLALRRALTYSRFASSSAFTLSFGNFFAAAASAFSHSPAMGKIQRSKFLEL